MSARGAARVESAASEREATPAPATPICRIDAVRAAPLDSSDMRAVAHGHGAVFESWCRYWHRLAPDEREPLTHPAYVAGHLQGQLRSGTASGVSLLLFEGGGEVQSLIPVCAVPGRRNAVQHGRGFDCRSLALARADHGAALAQVFSTRIDGRRVASLYVDGVDETNSILSANWPRLDSADWYRSVIGLEGGYEAMLGRLSSKARNNVRRLGKKARRDHTIELESVTALDDLPDAFERYLRVDDRSWKQEGGSTVRDDARHRESLRASLAHLARDGSTVVHLLRADGQDIAGQLCCVIDRQLQVLKTSYDAEWASYGAGKLLLDESMRTWCPGRDIDSVNMVTGLGWHREWGPRRVATHGLWLFARGPRGRFARLAHVPPRKNVKRLLQQLGLEEPVRRLLKRDREV